MAQSFIYPVSQTVATEDGTRLEVGSGPALYYLYDGDNVTSHWHLTNNSIGHHVSSFGSDEVVRFDLGSSLEVSHVAVYSSVNTSSDLELYYSTTDNGVHMGTSTENPIITSPGMGTDYTIGWNVRSLVASTARYWYIRSVDSFMNASEIMLCKQYEFDSRPEISIRSNHTFGDKVDTSWYGREYVVKAHEMQTNWEWTWRSVSASTKTILEGIRDKVYDYKKFIYYDGTTYNWVRLAEDFNYTEVALNVFDVQVKLEGQLS